MLFSTVVVLLATVLVIPCWTIYGLLYQLKNAQRVGLPYVISPIDSWNPIWVLLRPRLMPLLERLPFGAGRFVRYSYLFWPWADRYHMHARLGDAFTIVTPVECQIVIADPDAVHEILQRRLDFVKPPPTRDPFNIFGENVNTTEGEAWHRQRKITTPPFNERSSSLVWSEATAQAKDMLKAWIEKSGQGVDSIKPDAYSLALHVLCGAGFGKSYPFGSRELSAPEAGHKLSYLVALRTILDNVFGTILLGSADLPNWLLSKSMREVKLSITEFRQYMVEMVSEEQQALKKGGFLDKANLMSTLVRSSEEAKCEQKDGGHQGLSNDEIYGNLFLYNLAGHETTGNVITYAIANLLSRPELQEWI